jgi:hypothetical protein
MRNMIGRSYRVARTLNFHCRLAGGSPLATFDVLRALLPPWFVVDQ